MTRSVLTHSNRQQPPFRHSSHLQRHLLAGRTSGHMVAQRPSAHALLCIRTSLFAILGQTFDRLLFARTSMDLKTAKEMAAILRVHWRSVINWARSGRIPSIQITPRILRFQPEEVLAALQKKADGK